MITSFPARVVRLLLCALPTAVVVLVVGAAAASAHVEVDPGSVAPGTFTTYTFTVPNELTDQDTIGVEVNVPAGFLVENAESLPGWKTTVETAANGTVTGVRWEGGSLGPRTFGQFSLRGRSPSRAGSLPFPVTQRYENQVVHWTGDEKSDTPTPTLVVTAGDVAGGAEAEGATGGESAPVPAAPQQQPTSNGSAADGGQDDLARSRADLALALSLAALLGGAGAAALVLAKRVRRG